MTIAASHEGFHKLNSVGAGYIEINPMLKHPDRFGHLRFADGDVVVGAEGQAQQEATPAEEDTATPETPKDTAAPETKTPEVEDAEVSKEDKTGQEEKDTVEDTEEVKALLKQIEDLQSQVKAGRETGRQSKAESTKAKTALETANTRITELEGIVAKFTHDALVSKIGAEFNIPATHVKYISGQTEEEIKASAEQVKKDFSLATGFTGFYSGGGSKTTTSQYLDGNGTFDLQGYLADQSK